MTTTHTPSPGPASTSAASAQRLADAELTLPSRLGHVTLLLAALMMTIVVASLWVTEPALPPRTRIAFAGMIVVGLAWITFALWVLTRRRVLLARHRVVAGRMAVIFTSVFVAGALAVGYTAGGAAPFAAAVTGVAMLAGAVVLLIRAQRTVARLSARREALERELGSVRK